jgi:AraC-like DNA-binding protein
MGLTPKKYANIMRFQGALDFIDRNPDVNISDVAIDFGYYDQPAFVRAFKKCTGLAPSDYRKLIKSADYMSRIKNM